MKKEIWLKRSEEWIKQNPGKGTMYKVLAEEGEELPKESLLKHAKKIYSKKEPGNIGIYVVVCELSKRAYIGQSINVGTRLRSHKAGILKRLKTNSYKAMVEDYEKYGPEAFKFIQIKQIENPEHLTDEENESMIRYMEAGYKLYNQQINVNNLYCSPKIKQTIEILIQQCALKPQLIERVKELLLMD
jgi:hypothetical protein